MAKVLRHRSGKSVRAPSTGSLHFLVAFILAWLGLTLALLLTPPIPPFCRVTTAWSLGVCLRALGVAATVSGEVVRFPPAGSFQIITECTALYIAPIFVAAVLAAPVRWRQRAAALAWGVPLLIAFNLLRLVALALIMAHWPAAFDLFHDYLWQVLFGATVIVAWWIWCERALRRPQAQAAARPAEA